MADEDLTFDEYRRRLAENLKLEQEKRQKQLRGELKPKVITKYKKVRIKPKRRNAHTPKRRALAMQRFFRAMGMLPPPRLPMRKATLKRSVTQQEERMLRRGQELRRFKRASNLDHNAVMRDFIEQKRRALLLKQAHEQRLSPSVQRQLNQILRIQNLSKAHDFEQQRRFRERKLIQSATSILATPNIFTQTLIDPTKEIKELNPLRAENVFKELPDNFILRKRAKTILDTDSENNTLRF